MIEAVPAGFFSRDYVLHKHRRPVGRLSPASWRSRAELAIDGAHFLLRREGAFGGAFLLEQGDQVLARAVKRSAFKNELVLEVSGRSYTLRRDSVWRRDYGLFVHRQRIGGVAPVAWHSRRATVRTPEEWSLAQQAFMFWLVSSLWAQAAAAAG